MTSDLLLVLRLRVKDNLRGKGEENVFEELRRKVESHKVMSVFEDLKNVACRIDPKQNSFRCK